MKLILPSVFAIKKGPTLMRRTFSVKVPRAGVEPARV